MVNHIYYPVKVHLPGCKCKHYNDKTTNSKQVLVSPYIKSDFKKKYFIYDSMDEFNLDKGLFINNCLCTHSDGIYNGGVIIITDEFKKLNVSNNDELENLEFVKFDDIKYNIDNSNLINNFCKMFPTLSDWTTLIGNTISQSNVVNYTFPKGKISTYDSTSEECCYREFEEETNCQLSSDIISEEKQLQLRVEKKLKYIPLDIIIDNFLMKIIMI